MCRSEPNQKEKLYIPYNDKEVKVHRTIDFLLICFDFRNRREAKSEGRHRDHHSSCVKSKVKGHNNDDRSFRPFGVDLGVGRSGDPRLKSRVSVFLVVTGCEWVTFGEIYEGSKVFRSRVRKESGSSPVRNKGRKESSGTGAGHDFFLSE